MDAAYCNDQIDNRKPQYTVFSVLPDNALFTTARLVLNPSQSVDVSNHSMIDNLKVLA
jgi:hypothetical protein